MRVALILPSRSDPAHRRVGSELGRALALRGHALFLYPPRDDPGPGRARQDLERFLREKRIEVCHVQFFSRGLGYLRGARLPPRTRVILTYQGASVDFMEHPQAFRSLARRADRVTAVSRQGLAELARRFPGILPKSSIVSNGVRLDKPTTANRGIRSRGSRSPQRPYILCVGRLAAYKGGDILALAFAGLAAENEGLDLVICGPDQTGGRLRDFIRRLGLGKRVHLPGELGCGMVRSLIAGSLFFVLPSRQENLPMALLEAMAAGKAVAATAVGGVADIIEDRVSGLLVEPKDAGGLRRALRLLAGDAGLRRRLGRGARARAKLFGWPAIAARYEKLYGTLMSHKIVSAPP